MYMCLVYATAEYIVREMIDAFVRHTWPWPPAGSDQYVKIEDAIHACLVKRDGCDSGVFICHYDKNTASV